MNRQRPHLPLQFLVSALALLALVLSSSCSTGHASTDADPASRWEDDIAALERANRGAAKGGVVFVGSSSIRMWSTLEDDMAPVSVIRSGFGGARSIDVKRFADRLVVPHQPSAVVFYAGDNDFGSAGKASAQAVRDNFAGFVSAVRSAGVDPEFYFVSIKPSPRRQSRWPAMSRANALVEAFAHTDGRVNYVDVANAMLTSNGQPRPELFGDDGLHMNAMGYALWTDILKPILQSQVGPNPLYL